MKRSAKHPVEPAVSNARLVAVDGRPVCADCGREVVLQRSGVWAHARSQTGLASGNRRLSRDAMTIDRLLRLKGFDQFVARFPWAVRGNFATHRPVGRDEWREATRRLARYRQLLGRQRRRRVLPGGGNPYLELVAALAQPADSQLDQGVAAAMTQLPHWGLTPGVARLLDLPARRRELAALYSWAIPTEHALQALARFAPLLECGAGMGYWAALLRARCVDIVAYDVAPPGGGQNRFHVSGRRPWTEVREGSSLAAVRAHPDRTLLLCWPPYADDEASYVVLRRYAGGTLVFIGEAREGAAGSLRFHRELALNWTAIEQVALPTWPALNDGLTVYRRNVKRRRHTTRDRCSECGQFMPTGAIGRCADCFRRQPPALAIELDGQRIEYSASDLASMPGGLRRALERSPNRLV